ncbi:MAG: hypothetical protein KF726_03755 [Anaerolineae bacterium]|nr:hypothetical protein [Anaerolineae bacterium]
MSSHSHLHDPSFDRFVVSRSRVTFALILIALGGVFLLQQAGVLANSSNWWVIFIAIPGIVTLGSAVITYLRVGKLNSSVVTQGVIGVLVLLLSAIFIWDPTWSFTRGWKLDETFPFLRNMGSIWQWLLVLVGLLLVYFGVARASSTTAVFGLILAAVGGVFILNISWDVVWPLVIVAFGVWLLLTRRESDSEAK